MGIRTLHWLVLVVLVARCCPSLFMGRLRRSFMYSHCLSWTIRTVASLQYIVRIIAVLRPDTSFVRSRSSHSPYSCSTMQSHSGLFIGRFDHSIECLVRCTCLYSSVLFFHPFYCVISVHHYCSLDVSKYCNVAVLSSLLCSCCMCDSFFCSSVKLFLSAIVVQ
jgi:hypothetical protein